MGSRPDPDDGRVEVPEALLGDVGRDLRPEAAESRRLVSDDELARLRHRRGDQGGVERCERPWVDDLDAHAVGLELAGRPDRLGDERSERDDGDVASLADDPTDTELDPVPLLRHRLGIAEEELLLLEEDDGTLILLTNKGYLWGRKPDTMQRLRDWAFAGGTPVGHEEYYLRGNPTFEVPNGKHDWLTKHVFVGVGERRSDGNLLRYYALV